MLPYGEGEQTAVWAIINHVEQGPPTHGNHVVDHESGTGTTATSLWCADVVGFDLKVFLETVTIYEPRGPMISFQQRTYTRALVTPKWTAVVRTGNGFYSHILGHGRGVFLHGATCEGFRRDLAMLRLAC